MEEDTSPSLFQHMTGLAKANSKFSEQWMGIYGDLYDLYDIRLRFPEVFDNIVRVSLEDKDQATEHGQEIFNHLLQLLEQARDSQSTDFVERMQALRGLQVIHTNFDGAPYQFLERIQQKMKKEKELYLSSTQEEEERRRRNPRARHSDIEDTASASQETERLLELAEHTLKDASRALQDSERHQENFVVLYNEKSTEKEQIQEAKESGYKEKAQYIDKLLQDQNIRNFKMRQLLMERQTLAFDKMREMLDHVWNLIDEWKNDLKLDICCLSKLKKGIVPVLDKICGRATRLLLQELSVIDRVESMFSKLQYKGGEELTTNLKVISTCLKEKLKTHLNKIFVVDRNPNRVLKVTNGNAKENRRNSLPFQMGVRILGGNELNLRVSVPVVNSYIYKEKDISSAIHKDASPFCNITNGKGKRMEQDMMSRGSADPAFEGQWVADFRTVQLEKVPQINRAADTLVTENKFGIVFKTKLKIRDEEYALVTCSLPIILISHVMQTPTANAFLMWDAAFSDRDEKRQLYEVPDQVQWKQVACMLNAIMKKHTEKELTAEQLLYLACILFKEKITDEKESYDRTISASKFIKQPMYKIKCKKEREKNFSFWQWFWACICLVTEKVKDEWKDGLIYGFISKENVTKKLREREPGTFMLRFSERDIENLAKANNCAHLTLGVVQEDPDEPAGTKKVYFIKDHMTPNELKERGLGQILAAMEVKDNQGMKKQLLTRVWPDSNFFQAFQEHINNKDRQIQMENDGYHKGRFKIEICLSKDVDKNSIGSSLPPPSPFPAEPYSPNSYNFEDDNTGIVLSPNSSQPPKKVVRVNPTNFSGDISQQPHLLLVDSNSNPGNQGPGHFTHHGHMTYYNGQLLENLEAMQMDPNVVGTTAGGSGHPHHSFLGQLQDAAPIQFPDQNMMQGGNPMLSNGEGVMAAPTRGQPMFTAAVSPTIIQQQVSHPDPSRSASSSHVAPTEFDTINGFLNSDEFNQNLLQNVQEGDIELGDDFDLERFNRPDPTP